MKKNSKTFTILLARLKKAELKQEKILKTITRVKSKLDKAIVSNSDLKKALEESSDTQQEILTSMSFRSFDDLPRKRLRKLSQ